ncbi:MAG: T9SS type A sorting domain-containing protein, partial [Fimbriimonadaceae bacterium]|nr:T9SS type A sorting domain-containing protein [Chitinophagales bacterium]
AINPGATDATCDGVDNNCNGSTDEDATYTIYYVDADGDTYGDDADLTGTSLCSDPGTGYSTTNDDCDDTDEDVNPGATEICNSIDDDCAGGIDNDVITATITPVGPTTFCKGGSVLLSANTGPGYMYIWKKGGSTIPGATSSSYSATKTGNYKVIIYVSEGCSDLSNTIAVSSMALPESAITNQDATTNLCVDPSIKLKANGGAGVTWQWYKNNVAISGATNVTYFATTMGNYKVSVTKTSTGCSKLSAGVLITHPCRIGEEAETVTYAGDVSLNLYPNPTDATFILDMNIPGVTDISADIEVFNMMGQLVIVSTGTITDSSLTESVTFENAAAGGVYFVKVRVNGEEYTTSVVLTR